jgi:predicted transcriptional regulator
VTEFTNTAGMNGPQLREWRRSLGMRVPDLADALGVTPATVYRYEQAQDVPTLVVWAVRGLHAMHKRTLHGGEAA